MRALIGMSFGVFPALLFAQAVQGSSGGYGTASPFSTAYDVSSQTVFSGTVVGKSTFRPAHSTADAESMLVKTSHGTIEVALGPEWYVKNQVAHVYVGEHVKVIGSNVTIYGARMVLAKQVVNTENNHVLALRDTSGWPYWIAARPTGELAETTPPANAEKISGTVEGLQTVTINGVTYQAYVVKTADGSINLLTAPTWYMNGQDFSIPVGTYIQAIGGPGPISLGNGTVLANSLSSGSQTIVLGNPGFPLWFGYNSPRF